MRAAVTASAVVIGVALFTIGVETQQRGGTAQTDKVQPVNSGANPYRVTRDWARLDVEARPWGGSNGVAIDRDGRSVWATDRCSPGTTPGCLGTKANPVHHFDESGKEIRSFGGGMFVWPHGIHVDRDGNVWVTDARAPSADDLKKFPGEENKGSVVVKFSPEGKVLLTLGKPGVRGNPPDALTDPTDVVTDPANGDVYVAESHTDVADPNLVARISVFDRSGKFLRVIGKTGTAPGEFRTPHALEFDSQGRLVVADRHNHRIQILSKDGKFIAEYDDFGRTSGLAIDGNDTIYTADSESTERVHPGWQRGIRIGSLKDGKVTIFVPPHMTPNSADGAMGEGIAVDAAGNVYTAEAQLRGVTKYSREVATQAAPLWLDRPMASWSQPATAVPPVKAGVESQSALERRCGSSSLTASPTAEAVRKAGWTPFVHFDRAIARDAIEVIGGMTAAAAPGCEPSMFNLFVFVGGTFAGTISPIVMGQGRDGVVGAVRVTAPDTLTAEFARYTTTDTECCPSSRVRVTFRIDRATSQPTLVPADIRTLR